MACQTYDCFIFNGEFEALEIRLKELDSVVDIFVLVEGTKTFSGKDKELTFRKNWDKLQPYWHKLRCVVVSDFPETKNAWDREKHQRNSIFRGIQDASDNDLIIMSDVDEIPRKEKINLAKNNIDNKAFGFKQDFFYFALNYQNISGPEAHITWSIAARKSLLKSHTPDTLRYGIRSGEIQALIIDNAGWHFSYLSDEIGIRKKIASFSHQEFNNNKFLKNINLEKILKGNKDLFDRDGFVWRSVSIENLPEYVKNNVSKFSQLLLDEKNNFLLPRHKISSIWSRFINQMRPKFKKKLAPIVICCFVKPQDVELVNKKFYLTRASANKPDFYFWHDLNLIGPEQAFQAAWNLFPDRDVIIIHTDMSPLPNDKSNIWYKKLLAAAESLPDAGIIGCDLLFPKKNNEDKWLVQCGGGLLQNGVISHICQIPYDELPQVARSVDWVTFGGIYIRREVIDMCGNFDSRYEWAYVKDVDYSLEVRLRGYKLYQVPINLIHEENGTTKTFLSQPVYQKKVERNFEVFYDKWSSILPRMTY